MAVTGCIQDPSSVAAHDTIQGSGVKLDVSWVLWRRRVSIFERAARGKEMAYE
jgi:hypothetical protein